ncbi:hypothetical protein [Rhizobium multihospitium]|nr:hypothetical protein [Rhizobium multihospitium]
MLRGIAKCGITVGDVPTDLDTAAGRIGVWFTDTADANGHGLEGARLDKKRVRLTVGIPDGDVKLVRWTDWSPINVSAKTRRALEKADGAAAATWWIYFGWVKPEWILEAHDNQDGAPITAWQTAFPEDISRPGIPYWRREAWQKKMLKDVRRAQEAMRR